MKNKNPYEYLKQEFLGEVSPVEQPDAKACTIIGSDGESITLLTGQLRSGEYVYGYDVRWANGRRSSLPVEPHDGVFRSEREALLYIVGFMLSFAEYFNEGTRNSLRDKEKQLLQIPLFPEYE